MATRIDRPQTTLVPQNNVQVSLNQNTPNTANTTNTTFAQAADLTKIPVVPNAGVGAVVVDSFSNDAARKNADTLIGANAAATNVLNFNVQKQSYEPASATLLAAQAVDSLHQPTIWETGRRATTAALVGVSLLAAVPTAAMADTWRDPVPPTAVTMNAPAQTNPAFPNASSSTLRSPLMLQIQEKQLNQAATSSTSASLPSTTTTGTALNLPSLPSTDDIRYTLSPEAQKRADAAIRRFETRIMATMHHDVASLARGERPFETGGSMTPAQETELKNALKDMISEMPIGALSPTAVRGLQAALEASGQKVDDLGSKTLKELGKVGGDFAKNLVDEWRHDSPASFYTTAGAAAVAVGAYSYFEGSQVLNKLGIKPEVKTTLFHDALTLRAKAAWEQKLKNPRFDLSADTRFNIQSAQVRIGAGVIVGGPDFGSLGVQGGQASASVTNGKVSVGATAEFDKDFDFKSMNVSGSYTDEAWRVSGSTRFDDKFKPVDSKLDLTYRADKFSAGAGVEQNWRTGETRANVSAGYHPTDNLDVSIQGSHGPQTGSYIGLGLRYRF